MKLGIGSAQFGLDYGISNQRGKTPFGEVKNILEMAASRGIRVIDTAPLYSVSEKVLGETLPAGHRFDIVTKTPAFEGDQITRAQVRLLEKTFENSLAVLHQASVHGFLVHHANALLVKNGEWLFEAMQSLKQRGLIKKIGVSVYTPDEIDGVLEKYEIDLIQLPVNVLDQRLLESGHLRMLKRAGVEIHGRSVFLQGLLLMDPNTLPVHFSGIRQHLKNYQIYLGERGLTPLRGALGFVMGIGELGAIICGVNDRHQLEEILAAAEPPLNTDEMGRFALHDTAVLNPTRWLI
ncbi:MAG: aldo/keto reductase [Burkholderiales bacterium]